MIKLTISYCKKNVQNYNSEGASCGLEIEIDAALIENPADLQSRITSAYDQCRMAVDLQLHAPAAPPELPRIAAAPPAPAPAARPASNGADGPPRTARQFLGWFGKQSDETKESVKALGKAARLPSMIKEWSDAEAVDVYARVTDRPTGGESDHERFMRRMREKDADVRARSQAFVASTINR